MLGDQGRRQGDLPKSSPTISCAVGRPRGAYRSTADISIDYAQMLKDAADATEFDIDLDKELPADILEHPSVGYLARHGLERHYSFRSGWDYPGFYVGDASNLDDLVT